MSKNGNMMKREREAHVKTSLQSNNRSNRQSKTSVNVFSFLFWCAWVDSFSMCCLLSEVGASFSSLLYVLYVNEYHTATVTCTVYTRYTHLKDSFYKITLWWAWRFVSFADEPHMTSDRGMISAWYYSQYIGEELFDQRNPETKVDPCTHVSKTHCTFTLCKSIVMGVITHRYIHGQVHAMNLDTLIDTSWLIPWKINSITRRSQLKQMGKCVQQRAITKGHSNGSNLYPTSWGNAHQPVWQF